VYVLGYGSAATNTPGPPIKVGGDPEVMAIAR
jgi:hypothetical protein